MNWEYLGQHPEIIIGWLLVTICVITAAVWSYKVLVAKFKYTYTKEKDEAWQEEHSRRVKTDERCDELIDIARSATNNYRVALLTLRRIERTRRENEQTNQQKVG